MPDLPWFVYAMLLAPFGVIVIAAAYKTLQVRAASDWPSVEGRVVTSAAQMRSVRVIDDDREDGDDPEDDPHDRPPAAADAAETHGVHDGVVLALLLVDGGRMTVRADLLEVLAAAVLDGLRLAPLLHP